MCETRQDEHVYCIDCKYWDPDDEYSHVCQYEKVCDATNLEDSKPYSMRPKYEENDGVGIAIELGNLLFGHSRGNFPVGPRDEMQRIFEEFLARLGCDGYGHPDYDKPPKGMIMDERNGGFYNDTFTINPYYWGWEDDIAELPNFIYRPENFELRWYKYPMRDSYSNIKITPDDLRRMCDACLASVNESPDNQTVKKGENA